MKIVVDTWSGFKFPLECEKTDTVSGLVEAIRGKCVNPKRDTVVSEKLIFKETVISEPPSDNKTIEEVGISEGDSVKYVPELTPFEERPKPKTINVKFKMSGSRKVYDVEVQPHFNVITSKNILKRENEDLGDEISFYRVCNEKGEYLEEFSMGLSRLGVVDGSLLELKKAFEEDFTLTIKQMNGNNFEINAGSYVLVNALKEVIFEKLGKPAHAMNLLYEGKIMDPRSDLQSNGVKSGDAIQLVFRIKNK